MLKQVYLLEYLSSSELRLSLNLQNFTFENFSMSSWPHSPSSTGELLSCKRFPISTTIQLSLKSHLTSKNWRDSLKLLPWHRCLLLSAVWSDYHSLYSHNRLHFFPPGVPGCWSENGSSLVFICFLIKRKRLAFCFCFCISIQIRDRHSFLSWI